MGKRVVIDTHHDQIHQHQLHSSNNHVTTPVTTTTGTRNVRKRKCNSNSNKSHKTQRLSSSPASANAGHDDTWRYNNDDEDSSSNDGPPLGQLVTGRSVSSKQANNSSILLNNSFNLSFANTEHNASLTESPKPVYTLRPSVINGTILYDLNQKPWRLGRPIGKGNFGEIFLASDNISIPVTNENANFVVKIEPHSNGPLFVEIHCLMNTAKKEKHFVKTEDEHASEACCALPQEEPSGIPNYIASGSHYFGNARYRFLVLPRFDRDLHSLIKKSRVHQKSVLTLAIHIINVLENLHDRGYCHNDVKAQNLMISKCKYLTCEKKPTDNKRKDQSMQYTSKNLNVSSNEGGKRTIKPSASAKYDHYEEKQQTTDSGNSSEQEANEDDDDDMDANDDSNYVVKRNIYNKLFNDEDDDYQASEGEADEGDEDVDDDDEDFDDGATTNSTNSNSIDNYHTPKNPQKKTRSSRNVVEYSGSNPVRSCRKMNGERQANSIYDEMVKSHYLRPAKRVSYMEFFSEDNNSVSDKGAPDTQGYFQSNTSDAESDEFQPPYSIKRSIKKTIQARSLKKPVLSESRRLTRRQEKILGKNKFPDDIGRGGVNVNKLSELQKKLVEVEEERIFLIDYGLASKFIDNGIHRPFVMDQRRAHDGTLEYTSRDAHMGAHSRRSDMECLGYNLLFWSQGYLPWKEAATNQQQEKVHRAKEYLMTDVRELLRQIYGKQVPKYLGEYLHLVGQLAYHERPDYKRYRRLFEKEYEQLGHSLSDMRLQMREIQRTCVRVKEEIENKNDFFDMTKNNGGGVLNVAYSVMHMNIGGCGTPFHERTLSNRVSPKNLRSKSDKKGTKKNKFSWAEILSQDPDQIARERAEKEFDREEELGDVQQPSVRRYQGKPTYAIVEILERMGRSVDEYERERDLEVKSKMKNLKNEKNQMSMDVCDNIEPMDVNDADESDDGEETDATESSLRRRSSTTATTARKRVKSQRQKTQNSSAVSVRTKTRPTASRKLDLKTPGSSGTATTEEQQTPVNKRITRCQKASIVKTESPLQSIDDTPISSLANKGTTAMAAKSIKRGSATVSKNSRKIRTASSSAAAVTPQELDQPASSSSKRTSTRERRARRCLHKTEQQQHMASTNAEDLLNHDSNSNFMTEDGGGGTWKSSNYQQSNETAYARKK